MVKPGSALSPDIWLRDIFACKAVQNGQVLRRKIRDIERYAGMEAFLAEVRARGFLAVQNRGQVVVFCNSAPIRRLV
ncbi:aspartate aminotransferase [Leisingera caerulea]|uniref:aspartate aminotransferase n=1 Tax=Leisingera caerulea TaxID=506591 RepID=UPI0021A90048|nr:aspartate aminotransferase [Leisingera caerulea]UWQ61162.1 aspartate aminotransferase [Leisingera caerulea]